jgi:hypothetical protein
MKSIPRLAADFERERATEDPEVAADLCRRIAAVWTVFRHASPQHKYDLSEATHILRDIKEDAERAARKEYGRKRHVLHPTSGSAEDQELLEKVRCELDKIRSTYPNLRTKADRIRTLLRRFPKRWPNYKAAGEWLRRRHIEI